MKTYDSYKDCPDIANHTKCPEGYIEWHEWADEMQENHRSIRCPTCGYYAIWIPWKWREGAKEQDDYDYINGENVAPICPGCGVPITTSNAGGYRTYCADCCDDMPPLPGDGGWVLTGTRGSFRWERGE